MSEPIKTWRDAARILRLSNNTLWRRRKEFNCRTRYPWWEDEQAVRDWYKALTAPTDPPPLPPAPTEPTRRKQAPANMRALRKEVLG